MGDQLNGWPARQPSTHHYIDSKLFHVCRENPVVNHRKVKKVNTVQNSVKHKLRCMQNSEYLVLKCLDPVCKTKRGKSVGCPLGFVCLFVSLLNV